MPVRQVDEQGEERHREDAQRVDEGQHFVGGGEGGERLQAGGEDRELHVGVGVSFLLIVKSQKWG